MKYLIFVLMFAFVFCMGCENQDVPVQNISVNIDDILFIGQQAYSNIEFYPSNTTEKNLLCHSSDENILTINNSGVITPKNKGTATIEIQCQNGFTVTKTVSVYQIVSKPTIINTSEKWGPYEKIQGNGNSSGSQEIGINTGVDVVINPNTLVENARIIVVGKLSTDENCEKENTKFSQIRIEGTGEFSVDSITIDRLYIDILKNGEFTNCDFIVPPNNQATIDGWFTSSNLNFSKNIFRGKCSFRLFSFTGTYILENNLFISSVEFPSSSSLMNYITFRYNTFDIQYASFVGNETPNIDFANNYWGTTNTSLIDNFIIDRNDSLSINYIVNYQPILTQKHELTPSLE
jgi:hypothetical protein